MKYEIVTDGKRFAIRKKTWLGWRFCQPTMFDTYWITAQQAASCSLVWFTNRELCEMFLSRLTGGKAVQP